MLPPSVVTRPASAVSGTEVNLAGGRIIERGTPAGIKARHGALTLEDAYLTLVGHQAS